jgi:transcription elongation factor Elf1
MVWKRSRDQAERLNRGAFQVEHFFDCPYCGEQISMIVDLSVRRQIYIEDCEVCCKPIEIACTVEDDAIADFRVKTLE